MGRDFTLEIILQRVRVGTSGDEAIGEDEFASFELEHPFEEIGFLSIELAGLLPELDKPRDEANETVQILLLV